MWNIVRCAVQGRSHQVANVPCQDKTWECQKNNVYAIALADGAGSAVLSHFGAERVCTYICEQLCDRFDEIFAAEDGAAVKQAMLCELAEQLAQLAEELECDVKDLASTLQAVAVKGEHFLLAHIGDGVIGYLKGEELKVASLPANGEFANVTVFTTSKDALATMKMIKGELGEVRGFVLMSDGAAESLYNKQEKRLADAVGRIVDLCSYLPVETVQQQLQASFDTSIVQATTDDCSMALLAKEREDFLGYGAMSFAEKCRLLKISAASGSARHRVETYDLILKELICGGNVAQISRVIHVKEPYAKRYLRRLLMLNLIQKEEGDSYRTIVKM